MSGQRHDIDPKNDKTGTQLQISASQMKSAARPAVIALALSVLAASLWLTARDDDKTSASSTVAPRSWRTFTAAVIPFPATDLVNPKRGQYQDIGISLYPQSATSGYPPWPGTYDAGDRFLWSQIQPASAGAYDFTPIDKEIAAAHAHNQRFHFRIMAFSSVGDENGNTVMGVPEWLHATPGATTDYYYEGKKYVVPNWNADTYLTPLEHLIAALGARYDHDERVEWFEFSGYGDFSENHIWFIASSLGAPGPAPGDSIAQLGYYSQYTAQSITKASITRIVNATLAAFPNTRIIVNGDNPEITRQLFAASPRRPAGMRSDCLGVDTPDWATTPDSWYVQHHDPIVTALLTRWRTAPIVTEWCQDQPNGATSYFRQAIEDTVNYHVSLVASNVLAPSPDMYDIWARTNKYAGYRYAITSTTTTVPPSATPGSALPITVRWTNFGTAPSYDNWQVVYELRDSENTVVKTVPSALALRNIAAEQNYTDPAQDPASAADDDKFSLPTSGLPAGSYTLAAKVVWNDHKPNGINTVDYPSMTLAQAGRDRDGGYPISSIQLTG